MSRILSTIFTRQNSNISYRTAGDAARDRADWAEAEKAYTQHLDSNPDDFAIWVQLGHALKEQRKYKNAQVAYEKAISLDDKDHDVLLQMGHLAKLAGFEVEAVNWYQRAYALSKSSTAIREIRSLGFEPEAEDDISALVGQKVSQIFFEVDDLLNYLKAHQTVSGIQRVQAGLVHHLVMNGIPAVEDKQQVCRFVIRGNDSDALNFRIVEEAHLIRIIEYVTGAAVIHSRLIALIKEAESGAYSANGEPGDVYFVLGAFWGYGGIASRYAKLKQSGIRLGGYIYDIIPITHPEYCDAELSHEFLLSFGDGLALFDFIVTISEFTAQEVRRLQAKYGLPAVPVRAVQLAHTMKFSTQSRQKSPSLGQISKFEEFSNKQYVLVVSTIEGRKNHLLLVNVWRHFLDEGLDPPDLVFVGRKGWKISGLMELLQSTSYLGGLVHILHDLSDAELEALYNNCIFTAFPSIVEGWGLPVGESLTYGKPCVASNSSSIPEVGGDLVDYMDPLNFRDAIDVFRSMNFDREYRETRKQNIAQNFKARTWADVGVDFALAISDLSNAAFNSGPQRSFDPGIFFKFGYLSGQQQRVPETYLAEPYRLMIANGFYPPEDFGSWMKGRCGEIRIQTKETPNTKIVVYLKFLIAPQMERLDVDLISLDERGERRQALHTKKATLMSRSNILRMPLSVDRDGSVSILIRTRDTIVALPNDSRLICLGVEGVGYVAASDIERRLELVESIIMC